MEKNKKIYKFTSIISITIVLTLMLNLILPKFTIADNEYRLSLNYNTESKELVAQANIAEEWVNNSTLYWIKTTEEVPSKDDLDKVADWCIMNSISDSVTLDSVNVYKTFKPKTDGQYYVAILIKEQDENGAEVYKKALIASDTSNGIIGKDLDDIKGDNQGTEPGGDQKDDNQGTKPSEDQKDDELHVDINKDNNKKDDYENLEDDVTKDLIDNKNDDKNNNKNDNNIKTPEKKDETIIEDKTPLNEANTVNKSKENIPQTGTNDSLVIIAMIMFSIIGMASFIRYKTIK